ncbi:hypothetical protein DPIBCGCG_00004 [Escherichia phage KKP 3715]|nr:hypothetical protein DPIBCGCG_00004 [Escherichia phage KKP 3715]
MKFVMTVPSFVKGESMYTTDFTLEEVMNSNPHQVILVPTLEDYHAVRGQLFLAGNNRKVVCLVPPSVYINHNANDPTPFMLVSDEYQWESRYEKGEYRYYYVRK